MKSDFGSSFSDVRRADHSNITPISSAVLAADLQYPKTSSQLVVQKKKVEELKLWLESALQNTRKVIQ